MTTRNWGDIKRKRFSETEIQASRKQAENDVLEMNLCAVRKLVGKTQHDVAAATKMAQGDISEFERREDHIVSKLRRYVTALGGELEVIARFDDKSVKLRGV